MNEVTAAEPFGLALEQNGHRTRLKWHRLRRRMADPLFSAVAMADGFRLGASMELDLRLRGDGGFVVLHDEVLEGETTSSGRIADWSRDDLRGVHYRDGAGAPPRSLLFSEDLAAMLGTAHADALLQFDMKDDLAAIGSRGLDHLVRQFSELPASIIVGANDLKLVLAVKDRLPRLPRGIDPSDKLGPIYQQGGLAAVEADLLADLRGPIEPNTVYLYWPLLLRARREGLDLVALCHGEGALVDAWTFNLKDPVAGFSDEEWENFSALMALKPDQITTDEAPATERAYLMRLGDRQ